MNCDEIINEIRRLELPLNKFVVFGSAPLCMRKLRESSDIDLLVTEDLFDELITKRGWKPRMALSGSDSAYIGDVEAFKDWPGVSDPKKVIEEADVFEGVPFAKLHYILDWKKSSGREKDSADIEIIEKHFKEEKEKVENKGM